MAGEAPTKGGVCTPSDTQLCYKTCGPLSIGFKSETCTGGVYVEQSGCSFRGAELRLLQDSDGGEPDLSSRGAASFAKLRQSLNARSATSEECTRTRREPQKGRLLRMPQGGQLPALANGPARARRHGPVPLARDAEWGHRERARPRVTLRILAAVWRHSPCLRCSGRPIAELTYVCGTEPPRAAGRGVCGAGDPKLPPEPTLPTDMCQTLTAEKSFPDENNLDTARIQAALTGCKGEPSKLASNGQQQCVRRRTPQRRQRHPLDRRRNDALCVSQCGALSEDRIVRRAGHQRFRRVQRLLHSTNGPGPAHWALHRGKDLS